MDSPPESLPSPSQPDRASAESAPPSVPDHELFQRIGSGAYGEVWLARNLATGALRAVKIVFRSTFADERPFNREFEGIKKFDLVSRSHPSQLALFHVGRNDAAGYFYYVMELADDAGERSGEGVARSENGGKSIGHDPPSSIFEPRLYSAHTLRADLGHGRLPAARVLEIALALTEALAHLHAHALIHRDVKPSNIIFVGGRPKLADIGLVTDASDSRSIVGTEGYLPQEGPGTPAADIFALGKVLYEALTGLDRRQYPELPADLRQWADAPLAFELNTILVQACAANARERYASAEAMLADLKLLDAGKSVQRGWAWSWKAALFVALLGLTFQIIQNERARRAALTRLNASPFEQSGTTNLAAWEAGERAGTLGGTFTPAGLSNAIQEYERAVALDPNYVKAWESQAAALFLSVEKGYIPGGEALPRALICAGKAAKLDPSNAWAWEWIGECDVALDYDFVRAEPLMRKAVQLAQREPDKGFVLRHNLARQLWHYGRFDEAEAILHQIIREQPSQEGYSNLPLGMIHASRSRFADALTAVETCIRMQPDFLESHTARGEILWALHRRSEAARDWLHYVEQGGFTSLTHEDAATLNTTLNQAGPEGFLQSLIAALERRRAEGKFVSAYALARLHAQAGNKTRALDCLEAAVAEHDPYALSAKVHIVFRDFQAEPRYHAALRRLKLEQ